MAPAEEINDLADKTDNQLVELTLANQDNFLYLMKRYEGKLLSYILRISNIDRDEAEDVLQDVFIKTYKNLNNFDPDLKFSSWIYRITHNQVISNYRKIQARPQKYTFDVDDKILNNIASDFDIVKAVDITLLRHNVSEILNNLDEKFREVLILRFLEQKDYREISDILKKPMGTVATLLNRSKKAFRKELEKHLETKPKLWEKKI